MHKSNTNKVTLITIMSIIVLLIFVAIAYFAIAVSNTNNEKYSLTSAKISIIYTDCASSKQLG